MTFTLAAPQASSLQVAGGDGLGRGPFTMTNGPGGTWSVTIPPPVPGFHYYWFVLNGVEVNDTGRLLWIGVGTAEGPEMRASVGGAVDALRKSGVYLVYFESHGTRTSGRPGGGICTTSHRDCFDRDQLIWYGA